MISEKMAGMVYGFEQAIVISIADGGHKNVTDKWKESCARLIDEIAALEAARAWRPIETAPKDGTEILVFHQGTCEQFVVFWENNGWKYAPTWVLKSEPQHWMPIPEPPA